MSGIRSQHNRRIQYIEPLDSYFENRQFDDIQDKSDHSVAHTASQTDSLLQECSIPFSYDDGTESITLPKTPQYVYKQPNDIELAQKPKTKYVYLPVIPNPKFVKKPRRVLYAYNDFCPVHQKLRLHHYGETYDPRWWYMPLNAVHAPKSRRHMESRHHQYKPPKWYELPHREKYYN